MNIITLTLENNGWIATHTGDHRNSIIKMFGSDKLPCAFTSRAPANLVLAEITKLNPDCQVILK